MKTKTILLSNKPMPNDKLIGSWNVLLSKAILEGKIRFDYVLSSKSYSQKESFQGVTVRPNTYSFLRRRYIDKDTKYEYVKALRKIVGNKSCFFKIIIFDDVKLLKTINDFIKPKHSNFEVIYFLRGYNFDFDERKRKEILYSIDRLVTQTHLSVRHLLLNNHSIPCEINILPNGVNTEIFCPYSITKKLKLKENYFIENKKVFLWVSQNRKKKGLHILLKAWREFYLNNQDCVLLIVGTDSVDKFKDGIMYLGRKLNYELAELYNIADIFLFTTLCHEGHPLALTEALMCGCYCLASNISPIDEIIAGINHTVLVDYPNMTKSWFNAMNDVIAKFDSIQKQTIEIPIIYDREAWVNNFNRIING